MNNEREDSQIRDAKEIDPGEPISALAGFERDASSGLVTRIKRTIQRRTTLAQLASFSLGVPSLVLREFWSILVNRPDRTVLGKDAGHGKKLLDAFAALGNSIASAIPKIAFGTFLVIAGFVSVKLIELALRTMLTRVRFDSLMERAGVTNALRRIGLRQRLSLLLPKLAFFLVVFLLAKTVSDAFGLIAISNALGAFFSYLPSVLAALLLLILGTTAGQFTGRMVTRAAESWGLDSAPALGKLVSALIIFLVAMMAIGQLRIDTEMVRIVTSFVLGAAALGFGLAFGLGTRDIVRNIVTGFYARKFLAIGMNLTVAGYSGTLTSITPTHVVLYNEGNEIFVANATLLEQSSAQHQT